nr:hypothetical protein [Trichocoleus desertorum]
MTEVFAGLSAKWNRLKFQRAIASLQLSRFQFYLQQAQAVLL